MRDYKQKHTEAYTGMFSQIGELYNVKVKTLNYNFSGQQKYLYTRKL